MTNCIDGFIPSEEVGAWRMASDSHFQFTPTMLWSKMTMYLSSMLLLEQSTLLSVENVLKVTTLTDLWKLLFVVFNSGYWDIFTLTTECSKYDSLAQLQWVQSSTDPGKFLEVHLKSRGMLFQKKGSGDNMAKVPYSLEMLKTLFVKFMWHMMGESNILLLDFSHHKTLPFVLFLWLLC